jgi:tight adherence protein B
VIPGPALGFVAAACAGLGVHFLTYPKVGKAKTGRHFSMNDWLRQAGIEGVRIQELVAVELVVFVAAFGMVWSIFGATVPALLTGIGAMAAPLATYRQRRQRMVEQARDAWPSMLEELRLEVGAMGRSVPAALFDVGRRSPIDTVRQAFEAAHREWLLSTDFPRVIRLLQDRLADPTADTVLETLLVASEIGGTDVDRRLARLAADRQVDLRHRHEAVSRQSGVRFARYFVLVVPFGMALVGLGIGDGRAAYSSASGQLTGAIAVALIGGCWWWSGHIMKLPDTRRVARTEDDRP